MAAGGLAEFGPADEQQCRLAGPYDGDCRRSEAHTPMTKFSARYLVQPRGRSTGPDAARAGRRASAPPRRARACAARSERVGQIALLVGGVSGSPAGRRTARFGPGCSAPDRSTPPLVRLLVIAPVVGRNRLFGRSRRGAPEAYRVALGSCRQCRCHHAPGGRMPGLPGARPVDTWAARRLRKIVRRLRLRLSRPS